MSVFRDKVRTLFEYLQSNPSKLEDRCHSTMKSMLNHFCGNGQGLGNKCNDQEACFAVECEAHGWQLLTEDADEGFYYTYQARGTQRAIDFQLMYIEGGEVIESIDIDLKHGDKEGIFLNDGTFLTNVVYILSFTRLLPRVKGQARCPRQQICFIGLGNDIMTEDERNDLMEWREDLRLKNQRTKNRSSRLKLYARSANQFDVSDFTPEFTRECYQKLLAWLEPSLVQIATEQHSQSV